MEDQIPAQLPSAEEIVRRLERHSIADHPYFKQLAREPVDLTRLWRLLANGRVGVVIDFSKRLAHVISRLDDEHLRSLLAKQLNDELGSGNFDKAHRPLYERMLAAFDPWKPSKMTPDVLAPGRELHLRLQAIYHDPEPYAGVGASIAIEVFGKQIDLQVGREARRQEAVPLSRMEWLTAHETLEIDHVDESGDMARLVPTSGAALQNTWWGAEAVGAAFWDFFDALYGQKTERMPPPILPTMRTGGAYPRASAKLIGEGQAARPKQITPERMTAADFAKVRDSFPSLEERVYFASQCLGPLPAGFWGDLEDYRKSLLLRKRAIPEWIDRVEDTTGLIETLLGAAPNTVALRDSATSAQSAIAAAVEARPDRNRIVITSLDFHSSRYLWKAQTRRGFVIDEVDPHDGIEVTPEQIVAAIDSRTAIVQLSVVSPKTGGLIDARPVIRAARKHGAIVILDVYQAAGAIPFDVQALDADVVVGGTHKWLSGGSSGLAFLYMRPAIAEALAPVYPGWFGHGHLASSFAEGFVPAPLARGFQQGTPAIEPLYTARTGLVLAIETGVENIRARSLSLTGRMLERADHHGLRVRSPRRPEARGTFLCFEVPDPERVVVTLEERGIDIDWRPGAGLRVAPHYCSTEEECDRVIDAVAEVVRS